MNPDNPNPLDPQPSHQIGEVFNPTDPAASSPDTATPQPVSSPGPELDNIPSTPSLAPEPVIPASSMNKPTEQQKPRKKFGVPKKVLVAFVAFIILAGGSAAAYFGYVVPNKPENIWSSALKNTGRGYDKLSDYATSQKSAKGWSTDGSFKISGTLAADGTFSGHSDGKSGQLTGSTSAAGLNIKYDVRALESSGNSPDIYFKIDGVQGLGTLVSGFSGEAASLDNSQITQALNGLNGQWYFVDHTLFDQFAKSANSDLQFSSKDIDEVLKAVGDASKQYVFTTDPQKMAVVVKQNVGKESQDGRNVYHYKVGINKGNLKAYNKALCEKLAPTKLFKLFGSASGSGDTDLLKQCQDNTDIEKISPNDTADAWVDLNTRLIHKIRLTEKSNKNNYTDIIQNYTGGDEFPFSLAFHNQSSVDCGISVEGSSSSCNKSDVSTGTINMKLNMKTNTFNVDAKFATTGSSKDTGTFKLKVVPSNNTPKVDKPAGAKTIIELLNDLGIGGTDANSAHESAKDTERKSDISALQTQLETYYADNGYYPTLANLNDAAWRKTNMPRLDREALRDPEGALPKLVASAQATAYSYSPAPANCTGQSCTDYTLTATLSNGSKYTRQSLN
jgi:hypothetical protein